MKKIFLITFILIGFGAYQISQAQNWYDPTYELDKSKWSRTMTVTCQLNIEGMNSDDPNDLVGAFVNGECRGVARADQYIPSTGNFLAYLIISSDVASGEKVHFKIYDYSENNEFDAPNTLDFVEDSNYGYAGDPFIFYTQNHRVPPTIDFFSPNGDGYNDIWKLQSPELYEGYEIFIYNQMQRIIFEENPFVSGWDGKYDGSNVQEGVYYYVLRSPDGANVFTGSITLMR